MSEKGDTYYLDCCTRFPPSIHTVQTMQHSLEHPNWVDPTTHYACSTDPENWIRRLKLAMGLEEEDVVVEWVSCGEEAVHQVHTSYMCSGSGKQQIVTSPLSPASILHSLDALDACASPCASPCMPLYAEVSSWGSVESIQSLISPHVGLVSLCGANGILGTLEPLERIALECGSCGVPLHVEVSSMVGMVPIPTEGIDAWSIEGALVGGPPGVGVLIYRKGAPIRSLVPRRMLPWMWIDALVCAIETRVAEQLSSATHASMLRCVLEEELTRSPSFYTWGDREAMLPHVLVGGFRNISHAHLLYQLAQEGVMLTVGGGSLQRIDAMLGRCGVDVINAQELWSVALDPAMAPEDVREAGKIIYREAERMRNWSVKRHP